MKITIQLEAQVRRAAGIAATSVDVAEGPTVAELVRQLASNSDEPVRRILVDDAGVPRPTLMVFVNEEHHALGSDRRLTSADSVTITSPISGG